MQTIIYQQFQQHLKSGDRDSAQKLIRQYIKDNPNDAEGWYLAATLASKEQRLQLFNKALALDPFHDKTLVALKKIQNREQFNQSSSEKQTLPPPSKRRKSTRPLTVGLLIALTIILLMLIRHNQQTAKDGRRQLQEHFDGIEATIRAERGQYQWRGDGGVWTINYRTGDMWFRPDD